MGDQPTLTVMEAAKRLGISKNHAYNAAKSGQLPVLRIGTRVLVLRVPFERMLSGERLPQPSPSTARPSTK